MFITEPVSQTVNEGATVTFTALAINATGYQWRKNGINIPNEIGPTLQLQDVNRQSEGDYSVVAETDIGLATSSNATLRVLIAQRMDPPQLQCQRRCKYHAVRFSGFGSDWPQPREFWASNRYE